MAAYTVKARPRAQRDLRRLDRQARERVLTAIRDLGRDPRPPGVTPLEGHRPYLRMRVGNYRVTYLVDDAARVVEVARAGDRREIYRNLDL